MIERPPPPARIPDEDEVVGWIQELSNWGRWGPDDGLGTLNFIGDAKRLEAAQLVSEGICLSLGADIVQGEVADPGLPGPQRYMLGTGLGLDQPADPGRVTRFPDRGSAFAIELFALVFHGKSITHLDALSHGFWGDRMYNGLPASSVNEWGGATRNDVTTACDGIVSRGVLLDAPAAFGRDWLDPDEPVFPADLEAMEQAAEVRLGTGDILLLRTGTTRYRRERRDTWGVHTGHAGYHATCLPWFAERQLAAVGMDAAQDVMPSGYPGLTMPIHTVGLVGMGLWLIDNCDLERLSATCAELGRWSFQFVLAPLRITGGTGSPANPLALL